MSSKKKITFRKNTDDDDQTSDQKPDTQSPPAKESTKKESTKKESTPSTKNITKSAKLISNLSSLPGGKLQITFNHLSMDPSFINALRRILIGEMRTYSLASNLQISHNTTSFNNEFILSKMKMIPAKVNDTRDLKWLEQNLIFRFCSQDNWDDPVVNTGDLDMHLTVHMLQIFDQEGNRVTQYDIREIFPYDFEIITLKKQQQIHISGEIASGIGRNHATWKGCLVAYKFENPVSQNKSKSSTGNNPITNQPNETIQEKQSYERNSLDNPEKISLTLKTTGHFSPLDCFRISLDTLEEHLITLRELIDNPMASAHTTKTTVEIIPHKDIDNYLQIKIQDLGEHEQPLATHTMGNLLAKHMYYRVLNMTNHDLNQVRQTMTSYRQPHPLDRIIELNIKVPEALYPDHQKDPSLRLFDDTVDDLLNHINQLRYELQ